MTYSDHCLIDLTAQPPRFLCTLCDAEQVLELSISLHEAAWIADQWINEHAACAEPAETWSSHPGLTANERNSTMQ